MFNEIHPRSGPDGREARTALPVSPGLKAFIAAIGTVACLGFAVITWWWGYAWATGIMLALALWAMADIVWQWRKHRARHRGGSTRNGTV